MSSFTSDRMGNMDMKHKRVSKRSTKMKKTDVNPYNNMGMTDLGIDPLPMTTGKVFDVDSQIEQNQKIDPKKVFENYKEPTKTKDKTKDKDKKKINHIGRKHIDKTYTLKYGM
tara:strand:+ start:6225 stop:6563 length:339 start_codon:yes stop_codon:yes gene_type:complete